MLLSVLKWSRGYLTVFLRGNSVERFMNLCRNKGILLWNVHMIGSCCICNVSVDGFKRMKNIAAKTKTRPVIQKRTGLPFLLKRYRNRTAFFFGMLVCFFCLYYSSLFVWKITVEGQYTHTQEEITEFLKTIDIVVGTKISKIDASLAEEKIRTYYDDIGWVSIEITGTRLYVHIAETNMPTKAADVSETESNLVASHDGIVRSIVTRAGTPLVEENEAVSKGAVLVSGLLNITGDDGETVEVKAVSADADIVLETNYSYQDSFSMEYEQAVYTGKEKTAYGLSLMGAVFFVENPLKKIVNFKNYDIIVSEHDVCLGKNFVLPLKFVKKQWREYDSVLESYSKEEAKQEAQEHLLRYLGVLEEKEVTVLDKKLNFSVTKAASTQTKQTKEASLVSMASVKGVITVLEPQEERKKITTKELAAAEEKNNTDMEEPD